MHTKRIPVIQFETHQNYHFQNYTAKYMKNVAKIIPKSCLYWPQTQFYPQHKV